ncbi:MAG TPA: hypothetical protein VN664_14760 [Burkholderiales bacterium]|nr:hypothetical protein [Burkholderiales bacterium]
MMNITELVRFMSLGLVLAAVPLVGACGSHARETWQEEVKLLDGHVINITQKRRYDRGKMPREFWLVFNVPESGNQEITWHENLVPRVLNVYQGKLYVVGTPWTEREFRQYGNPYPEYVPYRYEAGQWQRIPFTEVPQAIYDTNLLIETEPPKDMKFATFAIKAKEMADERIMDHHKRLSPTFKTSH